MPDQSTLEKDREAKMRKIRIRTALASVAIGVFLTVFLLSPVNDVREQLLDTISVQSVTLFVIYVFFSLSFGIAVAQITYDTLMFGPIERERQLQDRIRQREALRQQQAEPMTVDVIGRCTPVPATGKKEPVGTERDGT